MDLREKIAFLRGLAEGLDINKGSKEGKMFLAIIDVLEETASEIEDLHNQQEEQEEYLLAIDEDLRDVEDEVYDEDDDDDDDEDDYEYDDDDIDDILDDFEGGFIEIECPKCHETVRFDADLLADDEKIEISCPNCNAVVYFNGDCDCECHCDKETE